MASVSEVVRKIAALKIQGAEAIAEAGLRAWASARDKKKAERALLAARPTEPMLANLIALAKAGHDPEQLLAQLRADKEKIARAGAKLIRSGQIIFTHCHSSTVISILRLASAQGKRFVVCNTETRPLYQGRITARQLAAARIPVHHFVDSGAAIALSKAALFLIGADALTKEGVYNKIGSGLFARVAKQFKVPLIVCAHSLKWTKLVKVEQRSPAEVWPRAPKGVRIHNPAFELVPAKYISKIVCEKGIKSYKDFVRCKTR